MFRKVLLLALVCVAASEVVDDNLSTIIEEALNRTKSIRDNTAATINSGLNVYYVNDQAIRDTVREQFRMLGNLNEKDIEAVKASSQKLVRMATQVHAKPAVFNCISSRTEKTIQDLNTVVTNFDRTITQTGELKRAELFRLAYDLFQIRASGFFHDSYFKTSQKIKACSTPECVQEIVARYTLENGKICAEVKAMTRKYNQNVQKSKRDIKNTFITAKIEINKVKGNGMNSMRMCLIKKK